MEMEMEMFGDGDGIALLLNAFRCGSGSSKRILTCSTTCADGDNHKPYK